jgi:hypothetical protein
MKEATNKAMIKVKIFRAMANLLPRSLNSRRRVVTPIKMALKTNPALGP